MKQTKNITMFSIGYNGTIGELEKNLEDGTLDLDAITDLLGIKPFYKWTKDRKYPLPIGKDDFCPFAIWSTEVSTGYNIRNQCLETIKPLKTKIPELDKIKSLYNVEFSIIITPFTDERVCFNFDKDIIEFCYLTSTSIIMNGVVDSE